MTPSELLTKAADLVRDTAATATSDGWGRWAMLSDENNAWSALASPAVAPMWIYWLECAAAAWQASEARVRFFDTTRYDTRVGELDWKALALAELITGERAVLGVKEDG